MPLLETSETVNLDQQTPFEPADALYHMLVRMARVLIFPTDVPSPLDELPISQVRCLNTIENNEGRKMQEIAAKLNIKLPAMSQMVERLVRKGLLERRADPSDRRVARLHLTPNAKEMILEARLVRMDALRRIVALLEPDRVLSLTEELRTLTEIGETLRWQSMNSLAVQNPNISVGTVESHDPLVDILTQRAHNSRG